jgi:glycosyltransferase involved in cell wall biosynthesis
MSASRNLGIRHALGAYITFCDADDVWMPSKLSEQLSIFRSHPQIGVVCGAANYWRSWAGGKDRIVLSGPVQDIPLYPPAACLAVEPLGAAVAPCNDLLVRRDVVLRVGGFENEFTGMYEDQAFLAKIYLATPVYFSSQVSLKYRQHSESCMALAERDGYSKTARRHFLEWFAVYVRALPDPKPIDVESAIQRELMAYLHPSLYFLLSFPKKVARFTGRKIGSVKSLLTGSVP